MTCAISFHLKDSFEQSFSLRQQTAVRFPGLSSEHFLCQFDFGLSKFM